MTPKIENRAYAYQGDNVCSVSATLNIYAPSGQIIASTGISASYNLTQEDFAAEITRQVQEQVSAYLIKLAEVDELRIARFPTSTDFASAVDQIFDPIQTAIGG